MVSCDAAQAFSQTNGDPRYGDGIPQNNASDVEQEVHKSNLKNPNHIFNLYMYPTREKQTTDVKYSFM